MYLFKRDDANSTAQPPKPLAVEPSGAFDGNDGRWSTFYINLADSDAKGHGQNFRVLASTSLSVTMVPGQTEWCNDECANKRGVQVFNGEQPLGYDTRDSPTWKEAGLYTVPKPDWWTFDELNGTLGLDRVGMGETSPDSFMLDSNLVMAYTFDEFFLGYFGLAAGSVVTGGSETPPFLYNLAKSGAQIPSVSYGHTAGASYRNNNKGVQGNLVLGGYDSSRVKPEQGVSIDMPNEKNNTLVVGVQSIVYSSDSDREVNSVSFTDKSKGFLATIDSTLPYLWLPESVCDHFATNFRLTYDEDQEIYFVNDTAHRENTGLNATVSFRIGTGPETSNPFASIVLPYGAFDYSISDRTGDNATLYFPIKKSPDGIFVLGRTFLQEAYIIVDYERANFTVAPALFGENTNSDSLVPIYNATYTPPAATPTPIPSGGGGGGLSPGAVAGIVVGVVVVFLLAGLAFFFRWKKRRHAKQNLYAGKGEAIDTTLADREVKHGNFSELDSEPPNSPKQSISGIYGRDGKDVMQFPPISEMESPPAELYSPPPLSSTHSDGNGSADYFVAGGKVRRRGATRESSGNNTPGLQGAPLAELPGDDGQYQVGGVHFDPIPSPKLPPAQTRGPSDPSLHSKIDEVMKRSDNSPAGRQSTSRTRSRSRSRSAARVTEEQSAAQPDQPSVVPQAESEEPLERRPSHTRGLSDTTVQSDTTAVSLPTPEELEQWAMGGEEGPRRPLSE